MALVLSAAQALAIPHFSEPWRTIPLPRAGIAVAVVDADESGPKRLLVLDRGLTLHSFELDAAGGLRRLGSSDLDASDRDVFGGSPALPFHHGQLIGDDRPDLFAGFGSTALLAPGEPDGGYGEVRAYGFPGNVLGAPMDLDGDGHGDLVSSLGSSTGIFAWRRCVPEGGPGPLRIEGIGVSARPFVWRDVDDDGDVDVLAYAAGRDSILLLRNGGGGAYGAPEWQGFAPIAELNTQVFCGEFVGDDHPDLLLVSSEWYQAADSYRSQYSYRIHRGLEDGRFQFDAEPAPGPPELPGGSVRVEDWNGDGRDDLVVRGGSFPDNSFHVMLSDGAGGFAPSTWNLSGPGSQGVVAYDLDGDGVRDLIQMVDDGFLVRLSGDPAPSPSVMTVNKTPRWAEQRPHLVDVDGDGLRDLLGLVPAGFFGDGTDSLALQPGSPGGGFGTPVLWPAGLADVDAFHTGDLDGDGDADVFLVDNEGALQMWRNVGSQRFEGEPVRGGPLHVRESALADVDGDGVPELLATTGGPAGGIVVWRDLAGTPASADTLLPGTWMSCWVAEDLDGDGRVDFVVVEAPEYARYEVVVYLTEGAGNLVRVASAALPTYDVRRIVIGPANAGGQVPLLLEYDYYSGGSHDWFEYVAAEPNLRHVKAFAFERPFEDLKLADVNGDGRSDLLTLRGDGMRLYLADSEGSPGDPIAVVVGQYQEFVELEDRNGDARPDLVVIDPYNGRILVNWNLMEAPPSSARLLAVADDWTVTLSWSDMPPGAAQAYRFERRRAGHSDWTALGEMPPGTTGTWTDAAVPAGGSWSYRLVRRFGDGFLEPLATVNVSVIPDPTRPRLFAPAPNPARGPVTLAYELTAPGPLVLEVFDAAGRLVRRIDAGQRPAERATLTWNLRADSGERVASGLYFARIAGSSGARRIVVLR